MLPMLSEINQTQKDRYCIVSLFWTIKTLLHKSKEEGSGYQKPKARVWIKDIIISVEQYDTLHLCKERLPLKSV